MERRLRDLDAERKALSDELEALRRDTYTQQEETQPLNEDSSIVAIAPQMSAEAKLALFRRLFRGRDDVYAYRYDNPRTHKSGYAVAYEGGWAASKLDKKDRVCAPLTDTVIRNHLRGIDPDRNGRDFVVGIYPLLIDETCSFLAADFDKATWQDDARAYMETCLTLGVCAAMERSRSGNGAHVWIFFNDPISAVIARKLGAAIITRTMERRPEIGFDSYDRFFPNQDLMPSGGLGNLIALPLQRKPRENGNSVFLDHDLVPHADQIGFLASLKRMSYDDVAQIVDQAARSGQVLGVRLAGDNDDAQPWMAPPSRRSAPPKITGALPKGVELVLGNEIYVPKEGMPPGLINRLIRTAAFQNPEFYRAQAMRINTFATPRIIACAENFPLHIGLPRGCMDLVVDLFEKLGISVTVKDERFNGEPLKLTFQGRLKPEQEVAVQHLLAHETGVLSATTAFGKTVIAAHLIALRGVNTLVLVHRRQLLDQWIERLLEFLDIDRKSIGQIGAGKRKTTGMLDVALIQSLCRQGIVDDVVGQYGHLVVDECHHISAQSFEQVARRCKARYVTGLSATTERKDGHHPIIFMQCGPIRYRVDARKQADLRPFDHKVIVRTTSFNPVAPPEGVTIQGLYNELAGDSERNKLILSDVRDAVAAGRSPVVLTERKEHLELLAERLEAQFNNVVVFRGGMGARQRKQVSDQLNAVPDGDERILLSTGRYLGEGFDDARLDTLFLAMPISWRGTLAQYAGRLHRLHDSKREVIIYDYADLNVPMLARMHDKRLVGYKAIGYTVGSETNLGGERPDGTAELDL
jgi:superfamily II DNA or RNA helicase